MRGGKGLASQMYVALSLEEILPLTHPKSEHFVDFENISDRAHVAMTQTTTN